MAEAVRSMVRIEAKEFPGYILTDLEDEDFLRNVMLQWGQMDASEVEELLNDLADHAMLTDNYLRDDGFWCEDNSMSKDTMEVCLIKLGEGMWVVDEMNFEELEEFVEACEMHVD